MAEGLGELGVPFFGSSNYWKKPDGSWLIKKREKKTGQEADAVVVSTGYLYWVQGQGRDQHGRLPDWILKRELRGKIVGMDFCDGYLSPITTKWSACFDIILRAHFNRRCWWPPQTRPWAFGLTERILTSAAKCTTELSLKKGCLFAFGASHGYAHGAREHAKKNLLAEISSRMSVITHQDKLTQPPSDLGERHLWFQCAGRHSSEYFRRLSSAQICAAFCGELVPALPYQPDYLVGGNRAQIKKAVWSFISWIQGNPARLIQPDSWRFWEALACGTIVLHHDAEETGWTLPISPIPFKTYLPVSPDKKNLELYSVLQNKKDLAEIAQQGKEWAFQNYSPNASAKRFLELIKI